MRRREFILALGGSAAFAPFAARAQPVRLPTIGFLGASTTSNWSHWTAAFVQRMRELGWIEGRTVAIEYRWAEGRSGAERVALAAGHKAVSNPSADQSAAPPRGQRRVAASPLTQPARDFLCGAPAYCSRVGRFGSRVDGALARTFWRFCSIGRVRSRVRPVDAAGVPLALMLCAAGSQSLARTLRCDDPNGLPRSPERPYLHYVFLPSPIPV